MKTALVTGASGKIGTAIVIRLLEKGYTVTAHYNKNESGKTALLTEAEKIGKGDCLYFIKADLNDAKKAVSVADYALKTMGQVDLLVNNAGVDLYKLTDECTEEDYDFIMNVNFKAAFLITKTLLPSMITRKSGNVIFISSVLGDKGGSMETLYSASKGALISFSKALAKEVGLSGIRVNCVCPGAIDTPMNDIFEENEKRDICERTALGRLGHASEIADLVTFLASDRASFITGQTITADGCFNI